MEFDIKCRQSFVTAGELRKLLSKMEDDAPVLVQDQKGWFHTLEDFSHASITLEPCIGYLNDPEEDYYQYDYSLDF